MPESRSTNGHPRKPPRHKETYFDRPRQRHRDGPARPPRRTGHHDRRHRLHRHRDRTAGPRRCCSPGCACHADPDKRHGPYWQYTRKVRNKTVTRRLTPAQAALYQEWIANERVLRGLLAQMQQISDQARDLLLADPSQGQQPES